MNLRILFFLFFFTFVSDTLIGQVRIERVHPELKKYIKFQFEYKNLDTASKIEPTNTLPSLKQALFQSPINKTFIDKSHVYNCYGFICKLEVQLDKKVKLPTRFRLGSLDYVDSLEGK